MLRARILSVLLILVGGVFGERTLSFCQTILHNYALNPGYAYRDIPDPVVSPGSPDARRISQILGYDDWGRDQLPVQIAMGEYGEGSYLYSMQDADCPVILIPAGGTIISLRALASPGGIVPTMEATNISVCDSSGNWVTLNENPCKFMKYENKRIPTAAWEQKMDSNGNWTIEMIEPEGDLPAYIHDGNWFSIKFPANTTKDFRKVTFSMASKETFPVDTDDTTFYDHLRRNWLFIQLPLSNDPDILDRLPLPIDCKPADPEVFSPIEVHMQNYALNDSYAFRTIPDVDPDQPDVEEVFKNFVWDPYGIGGIFTQMHFDNLPERWDLYSGRDAEYPVILIPAETTTVKVRAVKGDLFKLESLRLPDKRGIWKSASYRQKRFYSYHKEGEWFSLTFPENKSGNFREISMELVTTKDYKHGIPGHESYRPLRRMWIFIQLPRTADTGIFRQIPKISWEDYMKRRK